MATIYLVQHAEKASGSGDPGLTERGVAEAARTGEWLRESGLHAGHPGRIHTSPLRRAVETARAIAQVTGSVICEDARLRERMNWDGSASLAGFLDEWARTVADRDFVPSCGDSSRAAGDRLLEFLREHVIDPGSIVAVSHGGVTVDLLRTLLGDDALPRQLIHSGVPSCAITRFEGLSAVEIASTVHLQSRAERR